MGDRTKYAIKVCHDVKRALWRKHACDVTCASQQARVCHLWLPCWCLYQITLTTQALRDKLVKSVSLRYADFKFVDKTPLPAPLHNSWDEPDRIKSSTFSNDYREVATKYEKVVPYNVLNSSFSHSLCFSHQVEISSAWPDPCHCRWFISKIYVPMDGIKVETDCQ